MYQSKNPYKYGTGRRKSSVARVHLFENGTGAITINGRDINDYFGLETLKMVVPWPLNSTDTLGKVDIVMPPSRGGGVIRPGRRSAPASPGPAADEPRVPSHPEEGRFPHPRSSYEGRKVRASRPLVAPQFSRDNRPDKPIQMLKKARNHAVFRAFPFKKSVVLCLVLAGFDLA